MRENYIKGYFDRKVEYALYEELVTTPKPGLVDRNGSGAHSDMNFDMFMTSIAAISSYITEMGVEGYRAEGLDGLFEKIRAIGIKAEEAMFNATGGVNTHKGAIYVLGLLAAAEGFLINRYKAYDIDFEEILDTASEIAKDSVIEYFRSIEIGVESLTHGEEIYRKYGIRGVRGEAHDGFPVIRNVLRALHSDTTHLVDEDFNDFKLNILFMIMRQLDDTNIISRAGLSGLDFAVSSANRILEAGGAYTYSGTTMINEFCDECIKRNISPGGAADSLEAVLFLFYNVKK